MKRESCAAESRDVEETPPHSRMKLSNERGAGSDTQCDGKSNTFPRVPNFRLEGEKIECGPLEGCIFPYKIIC